MARTARPAATRTGFHLVIDEFAYVTSSAFVDILAESRKVGLAVTLAHQHLAQVHDDVRAAVLANAATVIAFRVGAEDALALSRAVGDLSPIAMSDLARGEAWVRIAPTHTVPTSHHVQMFAALATHPGRSAKVRAHLRQLGQSREVVEKHLSGWLTPPERGRDRPIG
jgi:hypothetical protein